MHAILHGIGVSLYIPASQYRGKPKTNLQNFVALSSLVEGFSLKVIGIKCPQASDDSLFATGNR